MRVSIITVTYNAEATLERTLKSVNEQTYTDIEHIIVDGASRDRTLEIAKAFNVKVVSEPDKGLYDAMNKGIKLATGDYLVFLNAGDKLHDSSVVERVVETAQKESNAAIIYGNTAIVDNEGKFMYLRRLQPPKVLTWKSFKHGMLVCHQSFYVRRDIAQQYDLNYKFSADFDWCIRCMKEGEKRGMRNVYVPSSQSQLSSSTSFNSSQLILTDYLSEGMTTANHKASLKERLNIMAKHYGWATAIAMHIWFVFRIIIK